MPIQLDVHTGVQTAVVIASVLTVIGIITGLRAVFQSRNIPYYRMRRERNVRGWRNILFAFVMAAVAFLLNSYAEPVVYSFYDPTATPTITPSITVTPTKTLSPTISLTPTVTETPSVSDTPTITPTPHIPLAIEAQFEGNLTPPADTIFSKLQFTSLGLDALYRPIEVSDVFTNPISTIYAVFSYDKMQDGVQWTAIWYRQGELVNFETQVWSGGTGGIGYSDWSPKSEEWLPGEYQVQLFVGLDWLQVGFFSVTGAPATSTPTITVTPTKTPTPSATVTITPSSTPTVTPSRTPWPTVTRTQTPAPGTIIPTVTMTATITKMPKATATPVTPTITRWPTATPITPTPTVTRWPTATSP